MKTRKLFFIAGLLAALSYALADDNVPVGNVPAGIPQISLQVMVGTDGSEHSIPHRTPSKNPIQPSLYFDDEEVENKVTTETSCMVHCDFGWGGNSN